MLLHYFAKLNMPLLPHIFHYSFHKNIHRSSLFLIVNVIHIIWYLLPQHPSDWTSTACHVRNLLRVLYLSAEQYVSSLSVHSLVVSVFHLNLVKGRHPGLFHLACGPNTQIWIQCTTKFSKKYSSLSEKVRKMHGLISWHVWHCFEPRTSNNVTGTNVSKCKFLSNEDFMSI